MRWLAALGAAGTLQPASISVYKSAMQTQHELDFDGVNPWQSVRVRRLLGGIRRTAAARPRAEPTLALTPAVIASITRIAPASLLGVDSHSRMLYAAIMTATHAMLRPSELLGAPKLAERALTTSRITFFERASDSRVASLRARLADALHALPDRFEIALGASKADQSGSNPPVIVAAPSAVRALWVWMHVRRALVGGSTDDRVFISRAPHSTRIIGLSKDALCTHVSAALTAARIAHPRITGKAFRRGGASALTASGASTSTIAAALRHRSLHVQDRYSDAASKVARLTAASRSMDAATASQ